MNTPDGNQPGNGPGEMPPGAQGPAGPQQAQQADGQHYYGNPWAGMQDPGVPPHWYGHPGYAPPPPFPPPPPYGPQMGPQPVPGQQTAGPNGFENIFNDVADKNGLGMLKGMFNMEDGDFWKGALVGAAVVLLMTNEDLRNSLINGAAKTADAMKAGFSGFAGNGAEDEMSDDLDDSASSDNEEESEA